MLSMSAVSCTFGSNVNSSSNFFNGSFNTILETLGTSPQSPGKNEMAIYEKRFFDAMKEYGPRSGIPKREVSSESEEDILKGTRLMRRVFHKEPKVAQNALILNNICRVYRKVENKPTFPINPMEEKLGTSTQYPLKGEFLNPCNLHPFEGNADSKENGSTETGLVLLHFPKNSKVGKGEKTPALSDTRRVFHEIESKPTTMTSRIKECVRTIFYYLTFPFTLPFRYLFGKSEI